MMVADTVSVPVDDPVWALMIASLVPFVSFCWALRLHFHREGSIPAAMRWLSAASLAGYASFAVTLFARARHGVGLPTVVGLIMFALATALFWWAIATTRGRRFKVAYSRSEPDFILRDGPYAHIRHPFYASYILFWFGTACVAGRWQWLVALLLAGWYVTVARQEERAFRRSGLSDLYADYRHRAGMLAPRLWRR